MNETVNSGKLRNMTSIYLRCGDRFLLLYRIGSSVIEDSYTGTGGGHFEPHELNDARSCVMRELYEETGLTESDIDDLSLRYITLRLKNGEVRQNYYFFANYIGDRDDIVSSEGRLCWFDAKDIHGLKMPFSASFMLDHYLKEGQYTTHLYGGVATESGIDFTVLNEF